MMHVGALMFATDYAVGPDTLARELEARGYESFFVPEHTHIPTSRLSPWPGGNQLPDEYRHTYDPFVALSFAAAATQTLKLGTGICLLPQRDTLITAKLVASLDRLSGGRFLFGVGAGWNREELEHHGVEFGSRFRRMEEQIDAMRALWTQEAPAFSGAHVRFSASWQFPKPVSSPHPPILLGGESDHTLRRIVAACDGWLPRARGGFDAAANMDRLAAAARAAGRAISTLTVNVFGARPDLTTLECYREAGITRAILPLPPADQDTVWRMLDRYQPII
ncbi:MAG: LLM class F420-dependent oxidoreductase, partial [Gammaproteobacteria bacterium]